MTGGDISKQMGHEGEPDRLGHIDNSGVDIFPRARTHGL